MKIIAKKLLPAFVILLGLTASVILVQQKQLIGKKAAVTSSSTLYFIHSDNLGSTNMVTDSTGAVVSRQAYYPYGSTRSSEGDSPTQRQYTGQISDTDDTGLYYYNARYYNPTIAKFTQADKAMNTLNKYAYVGNNPVINTDPSGNMIDSYMVDFGEGESGGPANTRDDIYQGKDKIIGNIPELAGAFKYLNNKIQNSLSFTKLTPSCHFCFWYDNDNNAISMTSPTDAAADMQELTELFGKYTPNYEATYEIVFLHEARHHWQFTYDPQSKFTDYIASLAVSYGLTMGSNASDYYNYLIPPSYEISDVFDVSYQPPQLPLRPHGLWHSHDKNQVTASWEDSLEIDAIIAETMLSNSTSNAYRENYPQIWNSMISQWGYFNPSLFKLNLDSLPGGKPNKQTYY